MFIVEILPNRLYRLMQLCELVLLIRILPAEDFQSAAIIGDKSHINKSRPRRNKVMSATHS